MPSASVFLSPQGRLGPPAFWRAYILILGANIVLSVIAYAAGPGNALVGGVNFIGGLVLLWATFAVFVKRLHDAGASGAWVLLIAFVWTVVVGIIALVLVSLFAGEVLQTAMEDDAYANSPQFMADLQERTFAPVTVAMLGVNLLLGYILAALRSEPGHNAYGPPQGYGRDGGGA